MPACFMYGVCGCMHLYIHIRGPEEDAGVFFNGSMPYCLEARYPSEPDTHHAGEAGWPAPGIYPLPYPPHCVYRHLQTQQALSALGAGICAYAFMFHTHRAVSQPLCFLTTHTYVHVSKTHYTNENSNSD